MAMTLKKLLAVTPSNRHEWSAGVKIVGAKARKGPNGVPMYIAKVRSTVDNTGNAKQARKIDTYVASVEVFPKGQVIVSCSCPDFCFTWEYALNKKGAARIEYCNGEAPGTRNPSEKPGLCKHLVALGEMMQTKGLI